MIVDMVRNDLSRTAAAGSVKVEELFRIKTFTHLHQMVSTVTSELREGCSAADVIGKSFPMGSMTGAPKISAMKLIEEFEDMKRGVYSGSIGYIQPDGDFDFNVVIRSIVYDKKKKYLSYMAGSAITAGALAEREYEECMLKASSMEKVLSGL
jgi:para-aminobenzoate synthetase component 1